MAVTKEQLQQLQGLAGQYGGANSQQFKDYVNTNLGAGGYDKIVSGLQQVQQTGGLANQQQPKTLTSEQVIQQTQEPVNQAQPIQNYQTSAELPQNLAPKTMPQAEVKPTETTKVTTPTTTTDITYQEDKTPYDANKVISKAQQFTGADGRIYQTVRNSDNTLTTIDVTTGQPVTGKYTDAERDSIKQGFLKSPEQAQQEAQQQIQLDPNNLFNQIRSGQAPTKDIQNTDEYKKQRQRADNLGRFENMTAKDLSYSINNGDLLPGTQTYDDLKAIKPDLIREAEQLNALNSALATTEKPNTDTLTKITEQIFKIFNGDKTTLKTELSKNPEVIKLNTDMASKKNELNSLKDNINNAYRDIEKELSGSGATKGYIQALASRRTEDLTRDYNTKLNEYNTMAGQLQTITEMVSDEITAQEKEQTKQLQALQFMYGIAKDEQNYQRGLQAEERQREFQLQDIQAQRQYKTEEDQRNFEQQKEMLALQQDYQDRNIQTDMIQVGNKNVLINRKTGETIKSFDMPTEKVTQTQDWAKLSDGTLYNQRTGELKPVGTGMQTSTTQTPINRYDFIKKSEGFRDKAYQDSTGKWTIGYGFTSINGKPVKQGDTMTQVQADKSLIDIANKYTNFKNFVKVPLSEAQQTALNSFEYNLGQNIWKGDGKIIIDKINAGDFAGAGQDMLKFNKALNPKTGQREVLNGLTTRRQKEANLLQQIGGEPTQKQYTDNDIALLGSVAKLDKQGKETLRDNGYTEQDWANFNAGLLPPTKRQEADAKVIVDKVDDILSGDWSDAVGTLKSRIFTGAGTDRKVTEIKVNALKDLLAMANLDKIKGAMSDKDIEFLRNTATYLSTDLSEDEFEKTLNEIKNKYSSIAGGTPTVDITGTPTQTNTPTSGGRIKK